MLLQRISISLWEMPDSNPGPLPRIRTRDQWATTSQNYPYKSWKNFGSKGDVQYVMPLCNFQFWDNIFKAWFYLFQALLTLLWHCTFNQKILFFFLLQFIYIWKFFPSWEWLFSVLIISFRSILKKNKVYFFKIDKHCF